MSEKAANQKMDQIQDMDDSGITDDLPEIDGEKIERNIRWHIAAFRHTKKINEKKIQK